MRELTAVPSWIRAENRNCLRSIWVLLLPTSKRELRGKHWKESHLRKSSILILVLTILRYKLIILCSASGKKGLRRYGKMQSQASGNLQKNWKNCADISSNLLMNLPNTSSIIATKNWNISNDRQNFLKWITCWKLHIKKTQNPDSESLKQSNGLKNALSGILGKNMSSILR